MSDLTLHHRVQVDRSGPSGPCVWCGEQTDIWAITTFRPDLGRLPLHLFCGIWLRDAFSRAMQDGRVLTAEDQAGLQRIAALPQLGSGE